MKTEIEAEGAEDGHDEAEGFVAVFVDPRGRARAALVTAIERRPRFAPAPTLADPDVFSGTVH